MRKTRKGKLFTLIFSLIFIIVIITVNKLLIKESFGVNNEKIIIEANLDKYINYNLPNKETGTLVQYTLKTGIEYKDGYIPVKNSEITISLNQIDGKYPSAVKLISKSTKVTNGKTNNIQENYNYDTNMGKLVIRESNENENGEAINNSRSNQNDRNEYIIIAYYDTYSEQGEERQLDFNISIKSLLFTQDNMEIKGEGNLTNKVKENLGQLTSINSATENIYDGYIKSNIINGTTYNTQYKENKEIVISKKDAQQKISFLEDNIFVKIFENQNGEKTITQLNNKEDLIYKNTKILKEDISKILGENGTIEILNDNKEVIAKIDKDTQFNEYGEVIIQYGQDINNIILKTSDIINEGILRIENTKEIKNTMLDLNNTKIVTNTQILGIVDEENQNNTIEEKQIFNVEDKKLIDIKESYTNVSINMDNTKWTNQKQNEVTFEICLNSTSPEYNLFQNPTLKIELPNQVEKVILDDSSIIYSNGLILQEPYIETRKRWKLKYYS